MDRQIVYPGAIPLDTDILNAQRSTMIALGYLAQATLGTQAAACGLSCSPTTPETMSVNVGPGCMSQLSVVDAQAFGSLPAEPTTPLVKLGVNTQSTSFTLTAPSGSGLAVNYLIEGSFLEADADPVVLPYYNAASPSIPYSGPNNDGASQNTQRLQSVQLQVKAGTPATAGQQQTPAVDAGWSGLYVITVQSGQTAIGPANIAAMPGGPLIPWTLPSLAPGVSRMRAFSPASQGVWTIPYGVKLIRLRVWGGGGAGGAGFGGAGGGGAGGGYAEGYFSVAPGQAFTVTVGSGGSGEGTDGSGSSFGALISAGGGQAGASGGAGAGGAGGAAPGAGAGGTLNLQGSAGGPAYSAGSAWVSGRGGASFGGGGAELAVGSSSSTINGANANLPGGGGAGGVGTGLGGQGGPGLVLVEW